MKKLTEEQKIDNIDRYSSPRAWTKEEFLNCKVSILRKSFDDTELIANFFKEIYPWLDYYPRNYEPHELVYRSDPRCLYFDRGATFSDRERSPYQLYHFEIYDYAPGDWVSIHNLIKE